MTPQQIEGLAVKWEAGAETLETGAFYPLSVRHAADPEAARKAWDEQNKARAWGMRWCARELRHALARNGSEVRP